MGSRVDEILEESGVTNDAFLNDFENEVFKAMGISPEYCSNGADSIFAKTLVARNTEFRYTVLKVASFLLKYSKAKRYVNLPDGFIMILSKEDLKRNVRTKVLINRRLHGLTPPEVKKCLWDNKIMMRNKHVK